MSAGYGQFCPIAKATEVFATRWTPLVLRELLSGVTRFNDIHHGVPLMSRALLAERLRQMEFEGLVERRERKTGAGQDYVLTPAGEGFRPIIAALGQWGMAHVRTRITTEDLDPGFLLWALRIRTDVKGLPDRRIVIRFEFSEVPKNRSKYKIFWLLLDRKGVDVCAKDPGHPIDLVVRAKLFTLVQVFLGNISWQDALAADLSIDGEPTYVSQLPRWLRLDKLLGRDLHFVHAPV